MPNVRSSWVSEALSMERLIWGSMNVRDDTGEKAGGRLDWYSRRRPPIQSRTGGRNWNWNAFKHKSEGREGTKTGCGIFGLLLLCPHVSPSVPVGAGNRPRPDVDVWSHPQKWDMSGGSEFSTKACRGREAVCLFILRTSRLSAHLSHFVHLKRSGASVSVWDPPVAICSSFTLSTLKTNLNAAVSEAFFSLKYVLNRSIFQQ